MSELCPDLDWRELSSLNPAECQAETWTVQADGGGVEGIAFYFFCLHTQGSESQRVTNSRSQLGTISQRLSKLLRVLPLVSPSPPRWGKGKSNFHSKSEKDQFSDEENQGLPRDPTDHSFEHTSTPKSGLATCQRHLTEASQEPVRSEPSFSSLDRWKNSHSEGLRTTTNE